MRSHTINQTNGPALHVVETGPKTAQAIVFVHGYSQSHLVWQSQFDSSLADHFRLVAIDLRGHGESGKSHDGYADADAWAGDIREVVERLSIESFVLVGWSYGSLVALDYIATDDTARVDGLNLIGLVAGIGTAETDNWLQQGYLDLFPDLVSTDAETSVAAIGRFISLCFETELSQADRYFFTGMNAVVPPYVRDGMRNRTISYIDLFEEITVPVLFSHGKSDSVVSVDASYEAHHRTPRSSVSEYSNTGHTPFWESSERFNYELQEFVAGLS